MINGEGYYRSFYVQQQKIEASRKRLNRDSIDVSTNASSGISEFLDFLDYDISSKRQNGVFNEKMKFIVRNKITSAACTLQECKLDNNLLSQYIKICTKKRLHEAKSLYHKKKIDINRKLKVLEGYLMHQILNYYSILLDELSETRYKHSYENTENILFRARSKFLRDIKYFSYHLNIETKGKITISLLEHDSAQAKRCRKAIKENVNFARIIGAKVFDNIKVIQVFKLDHALLASSLQSKAASTESGNIKGLFCLVPKSSLHTFCSYGLHPQKYNLSELSDLEKKFPGLFHCPWFLNNNNPYNNNTFGVAKKLSYDSLGFDNLKFSRFSTPLCNMNGNTFQNKNIESIPLISENDLEEGLIISLCRVLVCHLRTISSDITDLEIQHAIDNKNDSIYSTKTEEYVMLNPQCVLPEFLMHVSYEANSFDKSKKVNRITITESSDEHVSSIISSNIVSWLPSQLAINNINTISSNDVANLFALSKFNNALTCKTHYHTYSKSYGNINQKNNFISKESIVIDIEKTIQSFHNTVI